MSFLDFKRFEQHLQTAHANTTVYIAAMSDPFERKAIFDQVKNFYPEYQTLFFDALEENVSKILEEIRTPSLFASQKIIFIDDASQLKKSSFPLEHLYPNIVLFLGCSSKKNPLNKALLDKACSLDLTKEKPWDKEKRLADFIATAFSKQKKTLSPHVYSLIFQKIGPDLALLYQQVNKLVCYVGDRNEITEKDVEEVVEESATQTAWKLGEEIVWKNAWKTDALIDSQLFYSLLSSLRYQLQLGLQICLLQEEGEPDIASHFSKIYPSTLRKRIDEVKPFGKIYFQKGLKELFQLELHAKTYPHSFSAYMDSFATKLTYF